MRLPVGGSAQLLRQAGIGHAARRDQAADTQRHNRKRAFARLQVTNLGINQMAASLPDAPLGGMRDSGYGYEGARDGIHAFQHFRLVSESVA